MTITVFPVDAVAGAPNYTGEQLRQAMSVLCGDAPSGRPLGAVSGVRPGTPTNTVTATSSTWTVKPHAGVLDLETSATAGPVMYAIGANVTGSVTAADATNPRVDLISIRQDDPAEGDGSSVPAAVVVYTAGTAASSPSAPATPARSIALAQINVPHSGGGSPTVTWVAPQMPTTGGLLAMGDDTASQAMTTSGQYYSIYTAAAVFTIPSTRKVRFYTTIQLVANAATAAHYLAKCAYNSGTTPVIGTATTPGRATSWNGATTATQTIEAEAIDTLTAGTYVIIPALQRGAGSSALDAITGASIFAYDAGPG